MLTRLIVSSYVWIIETALWVTITVSAVVGYQVSVPAMAAAGATVAPEFGWRVLGALVLPVFTFLVWAVFAGPALILVDVRQALRSIEARLKQAADASRTSSSERSEPSL
jgi:uncharacterized membrane protein